MTFYGSKPMNSTTSLIAKQYRLNQWTEEIRGCRTDLMERRSRNGAACMGSQSLLLSAQAGTQSISRDSPGRS